MDNETDNEMVYSFEREAYQEYMRKVKFISAGLKMMNIYVPKDMIHFVLSTPSIQLKDVIKASSSEIRRINKLFDFISSL